MNKLLRLAGICLLSAAAPAAHAHDWSTSTQMTRAAQDLLKTLSPEQREAMHFPFETVERASWSNLPILMVPPSGLLLKDMNDDQRMAAQALLGASMSSQGYAKFTGVMRLDDLLHELAQAQWNSTPEEERTRFRKAILETRDSTHYAVAVFGEPGSAKWGWRMSGHHAAANFTVSEGRVGFTPTFLGSSPRVVASGPYAGTMVLPQEGARGIELMQALTPAQQEKARVSDELAGDIFSGPGRQVGAAVAAGGQHRAGLRQLLQRLGEPLLQRLYLVLQIDDAFDASEVDTLVLAEPLHLAQLQDVAQRVAPPATDGAGGAASPGVPRAAAAAGRAAAGTLSGAGTLDAAAATRGGGRRPGSRMKALLNYFVRLCLLRAGPQDLPASGVLFWLALGANLLAGVLLLLLSVTMAWHSYLGVQVVMLRRRRDGSASDAWIELVPGPDTRRWVVSRKAAVLRAVRFGLLTREEALDLYDLSDEELDDWQSLVEEHGETALKATKIQRYRQP